MFEGSNHESIIYQDVVVLFKSWNNRCIIARETVATLERQGGSVSAEGTLPRIDDADHSKSRSLAQCLRALELRLRLLVLPHELRDIMQTTPRKDIRLSDENDTSLLNRYKIWVEGSTGSSWDWWPLSGPVPVVVESMSRLVTLLRDLS
ncbi:hypothetical protein M3J07_007510 [Ascochyta lentis]